MSAEHDRYMRSRLLRLVVGGLFLVLVVNLFFMMVLRHGYFQDQALDNRQIRFRVGAPRGRILDRDGFVLADNMFIADITLPRGSLTDAGPDSTLQRLMHWFSLPEKETLDRLRQQKSRAGSRLILVPNATLPQISAVEERGRQLPGVRVEARPRRRYLFGPLFAHIIGYVGEVGQADLDTVRFGTGYISGDMKGKQGVEARYEDALRGRSGIKLEEVNAAGRIVGRRAVWLRNVLHGDDVTLTVSLTLQSELAKIMGDQAGCAVALSTKTGEVLAAVSNPSFDPNLLTVSISSEQWNSLVNDPAKPFFNRIVQATYPPGSLYKPVTSLTGLQEGVVSQSGAFDPCPGGYYFGDRYFRCWKRGGHGEVDHMDAMVHSCDTFYYQLVLHLEIDDLAASARALGLGRKCTTLFPAESPGNIPDKQWYDERFGPRGWTRGVLLNNAIGQGEILVTPLQMALFCARLATSGRVPDPVFVSHPLGAPRTPPPPLPFKESDLGWIRGSLQQVVARGTGKAAALDDVVVAGKTGTAQNPHGEDHAWFMCFAPADEPEIALAIISENAGHGGSEAAPLAGRWLEAYFQYTGRLQAEDSKMTDPERGATP